MKLHELTATKQKTRKRVGRGDGSTGNFCGRGMNGQNARAGGGVRLGFEGGQTPLIRRMPKLRGFSNINRVENAPISLTLLSESFEADAKVSLESLWELKGVNTNSGDVKILNKGEIDKKLTISADIKISAGAIKAIEKAGGKVLK
jgi:large subunit ribosomal protein L15